MILKDIIILLLDDTSSNEQIYLQIKFYVKLWQGVIGLNKIL